jgi:hypothetical protein
MTAQLLDLHAQPRPGFIQSIYRGVRCLAIVSQPIMPSPPPIPLLPTTDLLRLSVAQRTSWSLASHLSRTINQ